MWQPHKPCQHRGSELFRLLANSRRRRDTALGLCGRSGDLSRDEPKGRLRERSQARRAARTGVSNAQLLGVRRSSRLTHKLESRQVMRCRLVRGLGGLDPLVRLLDGVLVCSAAVCCGADMCGTRLAWDTIGVGYGWRGIRLAWDTVGVGHGSRLALSTHPHARRTFWG